MNSTYGAHVVVLAAHRNQKVLGQFHLGHGALMDGECLEKLRRMAHGLGMLNYHTNRAGSGAVGNFNPVAT